MKEEQMQMLLGEFSRVHVRLDSMEQDIRVLKDDVKTLKGDVTALKGDVKTLKGDVTALKDDGTLLKTGLKDLKEEVSSLKLNIIKLEHRVSHLEDLESVLFEVKENGEITRNVVNRILEWTEDVSVAVKIPKIGKAIM